jgi:Na+-transporting NADH:ubiquinone oxidoreductase subunit B/electron transport complex protein RnfD
MMAVNQSLILIEKNKLIYLFGVLAILIASTIIFGTDVLWMSFVALLISGAVDLIFAHIRKYKVTLSLFITPLIMVLLLPPTLPLFMVGVGAFFTAFFAKGVFGGDDKYIFHPAVAGVLFLMITFPAQMNTMWLDPISNSITTSLPVMTIGAGSVYSFTDLLLGTVPGTIGSTFRIGILLIGVLFILNKIIDWRIPLSYIGFFMIWTMLFNLISDGSIGMLMMSVMTGSVLFAAVFLATDPPTIPKTNYGIWIYGLGLGLLTALIRAYAAFPEGVIFAIIIMNAVAPLIDSFFEKEVANE